MLDCFPPNRQVFHGRDTSVQPRFLWTTDANVHVLTVTFLHRLKFQENGPHDTDMSAQYRLVTPHVCLYT